MSQEIPLIDIHPAHWAIVHDILQKHVPQYEVWAFGSRATWKAKEFSDLDLAIITKEPLPLEVSASLSDDFSESDLPWKVDVVDWAITNDSFRKMIEQDKVVVKCGTESSGVMNEWRQSIWGDEVTLEYGKAIRGYSQMGGKYRVFGSNGPIGWISDALTQGPGIVLGRKGAYRGVEFSRDPFWVIDTAYYVVPKTALDMRWLYYAVKHYKLGEVDDGSPIPSTTRAAVYMLELNVPPKHEQRAIAQILGSLDDKIELNRKQNETLEAMARALFKAWFVDFEPVRAKQEGRWKRGQSLPGLPADLYDLFPDRFVESELGEIPEGWDIKKVETVLNRLPAKVRFTKDQVSSHGKIPVFEQGASIVLGFHDGDASYQASADDPAFVFGDHTCITKLSCQPFDISQNVIPLRGQGRPTMWVYYAINEKQKFEEYRRHWMELITKDIVVAPGNICLEFSNLATGSYIRMEQSDRESRFLAQLRDTLLPKLISGELRMTDAERIFGEASP